MSALSSDPAPFLTSCLGKELGHYLESLSEYLSGTVEGYVHRLSLVCSSPQPWPYPSSFYLPPQQHQHLPPSLLQPRSPPRHPCIQRMTFYTSGGSGESLNGLEEGRVMEPGCYPRLLPSPLQ